MPRTDPTALVDEVDTATALAAVVTDGLGKSALRGFVDDVFDVIAASHDLTVRQLEARTCTRRTAVRRARKLCPTR